MKTLITPLVIAFVVTVATFSASFANANPGKNPATVATFQTSMYTTVEGKLQISVEKEATGAVDIQFVNAQGKVLFTQRMTKRETIARLRLTVSDLPDGSYQVRITNNVDVTTHLVTLSTQQPISGNGRLVAIR